MSNQADLSANPTIDVPVEPSSAIQVVATPVEPSRLKDAIDFIESHAVVVGIETSTDDIAVVRNFLSYLNEGCKRVKKVFEDLLINRIKATRIEILLPGNIRLYLGNPPKYKAVSPGKLIDALMMLCAGDVDELGKCLSSDWFKKTEILTRCEDAPPELVADIRKSLGLAVDGQEPAPNLFDQLIKTTWSDTLEEGKPLKEKKLIVDTGYRRGSAKKAKVIA